MGDDSLELRQVAYSHEHAAVLTKHAQDHYRKIYGGPDTSPLETSDFTPPRGAFFLGYAAMDPVVMGGWRSHPPLEGWAPQSPAEIRRMFVHPAYRGRGFARKLLRTLEDSAHLAGADAMMLETGFVQVDAVGLYRACGYVEIPRFGHYADAEGSLHLGKLLATE